MAEKTNRKEHTSFVMYKEWARHFDILKDDEIGKLMRAVFAYVIDGEETEFEDRTMLVIFAMMKECFSRDEERWLQRCEKNRESVKKRWEKNTNVNNGKKTNTKNTEYESVSVNGSVNDSVYESESVNESEKDNVSENKDDFSQVRITENELDILYGLADRLTIEKYLSNIRDWQTKNRRFNSKPYTSIRKWLDEDGVIKEPVRKVGGGFGDFYTGSTNDPDGSISTAAYEAYAASIDFSTLPTTY